MQIANAYQVLCYMHLNLNLIFTKQAINLLLNRKYCVVLASNSLYSYHVPENPIKRKLLVGILFCWAFAKYLWKSNFIVVFAYHTYAGCIHMKCSVYMSECRFESQVHN